MKTLLFLCATVLSSLSLAGEVTAQPAPAAVPAAPAAAPAAAGEVTTTAAPAPPAAAGEVTTTAAPAPAPPAAGEVTTMAAPVAPTADGVTPPELKRTCMDAINSDQQWTNELAAIIEKRVRFQVHNAEAELIAMNKRHVVMAYAALWLIAIGFLVMQWRRQQALKRQIETLTRDLESAIKEPVK
jgi:hypothetical protein